MNREALLHSLEAVAAGLALQQETVEQASCFVFKGGDVITFNAEVMCLYKSPMDFEGAVPAQELMGILQKLPDDDVDVVVESGKCVVKGKGRRRATIAMDDNILLPYEKVETAVTWHPVHADFAEGVTTVQTVSSKKDKRFVCACIRIHPHYMEALDNLQMIRYTVPTPITVPMLVRTNAIQFIPALGMTEMAETRGWLHFRNPAGLTVRCRRYTEEYPDLDSIMPQNCRPVTLPGGLANSVGLAEVFSGETKDSNQVLVKLRPGFLYIKGEGSKGKFEEEKPVTYDGPPMAFMISAKLLTELTKRQAECELGEKFLKVKGARFVYITCLGVVEPVLGTR